MTLEQMDKFWGWSLQEWLKRLPLRPAAGLATALAATWLSSSCWFVAENGSMVAPLAPPSMEELTRRLTKRGTETEAQLQLRLTNATLEMACWQDYDYLLISGAAEDDQARFRGIMEAERLKSARFVESGGVA